MNKPKLLGLLVGAVSGYYLGGYYSDKKQFGPKPGDDQPTPDGFEFAEVEVNQKRTYQLGGAIIGGLAGMVGGPVVARKL